jgi:hypothetical protein
LSGLHACMAVDSRVAVLPLCHDGGCCVPVVAEIHHLQGFPEGARTR